MFFLLFGRGRGPRPNSKKQHTHPPKQQKHKHATAPSERVFVFCCLSGWACLGGGGVIFLFAVWAGGRIVFFLFGRGSCFCFCCLGGGSCFFFFAVWAGACCFFAVWAGGVFFFCCLGGGRVFFWLFGRGWGVHSLTGLPSSSSSDPTAKKTKQKTQKTRVP